MSSSMTVSHTSEFYNKDSHFDSLHTYNSDYHSLGADSASTTYYYDDLSYKSHPWQSLTTDFSSAHHQNAEDVTMSTALINSERHFNGISPLQECGELAQLAQYHAQWMADRVTLQHSSDLAILLSRSCSNRMGQSVGYGRSHAETHEYLMKGAGSASRLLDEGYSDIGVGAAWGTNGYLYVCQVFRG
eukprot:CAMPEP_0113317874 /NCGR_PEP_ID=MMETSP0010_2-20120614/12638_1 /TAXON_ID=216773 ORGANISM="Corethron hystrix, Strain 308" /NCGR_SAMPLE_ID=MMETSP0010_2 /ASSEMBLY_ACC=CAM_ASM_000155 /LENGTH=187 /DNA_ID=CAMNT_0000175003 /DNA_START=406 /DNA_END=969 /DNA_ORIENTATION=+ /assembly_acc=CAM_ASM_000155